MPPIGAATDPYAAAKPSFMFTEPDLSFSAICRPTRALEVITEADNP